MIGKDHVVIVTEYPETQYTREWDDIGPMLQEGIRYRLSQACASSLIDTAKSKSRAGRSDIRSRLHSMGRGYTPCSDGSVSVPATKNN